MNLTVDPNTAGDTHTSVQLCLQKTLKLLQNAGLPTDRMGGYLCLAFATLPTETLKEPLPFFSGFVGIADEQKLGRYRRNAEEKVARLFRYATHASSWQSRNEEQQSWGGGIRFAISAPQFFLDADQNQSVTCLGAFSGLPEHGDEALMLLLARKRGWKTPEERILLISQNPLAPFMQRVGCGTG